ncbi:hypothetical protein CerSpe_068550 [Prunus speciosa]
MDELEKRFGSHLRLSDKERGGLRIEDGECIDVLKGSQYTLVARVFTHKAVHREGFVGVFSRLWRGEDGVSIKEIGPRTFLIRFMNLRDKLRVLDMEPWTYRDNLVLMAETLPGIDAREVDLTTAVFWVQIHGVPLLNMTTAVARKIGSLIGHVLELDQVDGVECIGRFLRVRLRMEVEQPLMRGSFIDFPDEGSQWVTFKYEFLPEYCFICGCMGHPSRSCVENLDVAHDAPEVLQERLLAFTGLDASEDLRGRQLRRLGRTSPNVLASDPALNMVGSSCCRRRFSPHQNPSNNDRWDRINSDNWRSGQGGGSVDSTSLPCRTTPLGPALQEKISAERDEAARRRQVREVAWELGLLGQGAGGQQVGNSQDNLIHDGPSNSSILGEEV